MSRATHFTLIVGASILLWLEAPGAWDVFAGDLERVASSDMEDYRAEATSPGAAGSRVEVRLAGLAMTTVPQLFLALPPLSVTPSRR